MSEDTDVNNCRDPESCNEILNLDDPDIIDCEETIKTKLESENSTPNQIGDDLYLNMTKNKDCDEQSQSESDEKVGVDSQKSETAIESQISIEKVGVDSQKSETAIESQISIEKVAVDSQKSETAIESQNSVEKVEDTESNEIPTQSEEIKVEELTEEKVLQVAEENNCKPDDYSFCEWSENYESLEDDKPMEDVAGDPQKFILWASEKDEVEIVRKLLDEDPTLVNAKDNDLYTPLHRAAYSNSVEVIKLLLSYDADISARTTDGWEPLHSACKWDSVEAVSVLLQNGADINSLTQGNITPLHLAASNSSGRRTLEFLLWQPYIDPNIKNDAGDTPYDIAFRTGALADLFEMLEESVNEY